MGPRRPMTDAKRHFPPIRPTASAGPTRRGGTGDGRERQLGPATRRCVRLSPRLRDRVDPHRSAGERPVRGSAAARGETEARPQRKPAFCGARCQDAWSAPPKRAKSGSASRQGRAGLGVDARKSAPTRRADVALTGVTIAGPCLCAPAASSPAAPATGLGRRCLQVDRRARMLPRD